MRGLILECILLERSWNPLEILEYSRSGFTVLTVAFPWSGPGMVSESSGCISERSTCSAAGELLVVSHSLLHTAK